MKRLLVLTSVFEVLCGWDGSVAAQESALSIDAISRTDSQTRLAWRNLGADWRFTVQARAALGGGLWINRRSGSLWPLPNPEWSGPWAEEALTQFYRVVAVPAAERGKLISSVLVQELPQAQIALILAFNNISMKPDYAVRVYKLTYETVDPLGGRTRASGVLALPMGISRPLPLVSYQHGTVIKWSEAPSANLWGETLIGVVLASTGYATVLADFLGLGDSAGLHPYHHAASEATACVDMLRAARAFCAGNAIPLSAQLFLCGYSQGGHATMALHRELEEFHTNEFQMTASAPMAGAYDLSGVTAADFLSERVMPNPYYFIYVLASYQQVYQLTNRLADFLVAPYDWLLPPLLDGEHSAGSINAQMPSSPIQILRPELLATFKSDSNHPLRLALRDNDLIGWKPRAPLRLYHCSGDLDVSPANSAAALASFHRLGATQVELVDPKENAQHGECALPSLLAAKSWFDSLRE